MSPCAGPATYSNRPPSTLKQGATVDREGTKTSTVLLVLHPASKTNSVELHHIQYHVSEL